MSWFSGSPNLSPNPMSPAHNNLGKHVMLRTVCNYSQEHDLLMMRLFLEVVHIWLGFEHRWCFFLLIAEQMEEASWLVCDWRVHINGERERTLAHGEAQVSQTSLSIRGFLGLTLVGAWGSSFSCGEVESCWTGPLPLRSCLRCPVALPEPLLFPKVSALHFHTYRHGRSDLHQSELSVYMKLLSTVSHKTHS